MRILIVLRLTALAVLASWLVTAFPGGQASQAGWAGIALAAIVAPVLALVIHEAGHLAAGAGAGMRPVLMITGPLGFYWRGGRVWPQLRRGPFMLGGFTLCIPGSRRTIRGQTLAMLAGGPVASLLLSLTALTVAVSADGALRYAAVFTALVSGAIFVMAALPSTRKGMANDGAKIRILMEYGDRGRQLTAALAILAAARNGKPPSHWPRAELETMLSMGPQTPEGVSGLHYAYWVALDEGDLEQAEHLLTTLQEKAEGMSEVVAASAAFEAAAFHLFVRGEPETARALIKGRKMPVFEDQYLEPLLSAGLALADGNRRLAAFLAAAARRDLAQALFPAVAALHARWLERLERELDDPAGPEAAG